MNENERYRSAGAVLCERLVPPEVAAAMAYQISVQVRKSGGQSLAPPVITSKPCYEIYCYQWPVLLTFLWAMTPKIEAVVGRPLLPSYSYFRTYQHGDVCRIHADRPACEHSVSLTLAYSDNKPWALAVANDPAPVEQRGTIRGDGDFGGKGYSEFAMMPGDGVVYRGTDYLHGRLIPNPNRWSAHLFLHWVDREGPCREQAFDGRSVAGNTDFVFPAAV